MRLRIHTPPVYSYYSGLMIYETFPPAKYSIAEVVRSLSFLALAIMAFVSFVPATRDGLL